MKVKTLIVLISAVLCPHLGHAQDLSIQDTCMIVYGTGMGDAVPEYVTLNFKIASDVIRGDPDDVQYYIDNILWILDQMDTLNYRNFELWPRSVQNMSTIKRKTDSIQINFELKLNDVNTLSFAISRLSACRYWINKISYSYDETKTRMEAYKKAVDDAVEKANYAAKQFNFGVGKILHIEEIVPSLLEQVEPGICLTVKSTVKVVFQIYYSY